MIQHLALGDLPARLARRNDERRRVHTQPERALVAFEHGAHRGLRPVERVHEVLEIEVEPVVERNPDKRAETIASSGTTGIDSARNCARSSARATRLLVA